MRKRIFFFFSILFLIASHTEYLKAREYHVDMGVSSMRPIDSSKFVFLLSQRQNTDSDYNRKNLLFRNKTKLLLVAWLLFQNGLNELACARRQMTIGSLRA